MNSWERSMSANPPYEIYCLYHNKVFPKYYGKQIDQVTFVKMDKGPYVFKSKKHIYLQKSSWFHPIGKEWAEYEFYYSLYQGYLEEKVELPEYLGFIQYDMEFKGKAEEYQNTSIIDFIEDLIEMKQLHEKTLISFQPHSFEWMYNEHFIMDPSRSHVMQDSQYENCLVTILRECNLFLHQNKTIEALKENNLNLCGAFFAHKSIFIKVMEFLSTIIEDGRLEIFDKKMRYQGCMCERYITIFLEFLDLHKIAFDVHHRFLTTYPSPTLSERMSTYMVSMVGKFLRVKTPRIHKILKPYFSDKK